MINCPYWQDYLDEYKYQNRETLGEFAKGVYDEYINLCGFHLPEAQQALAEHLEMEKKRMLWIY